MQNNVVQNVFKTRLLSVTRLMHQRDIVDVDDFSLWKLQEDREQGW